MKYNLNVCMCIYSGGMQNMQKEILSSQEGLACLSSAVNSVLNDKGCKVRQYQEGVEEDGKNKR